MKFSEDLTYSLFLLYLLSITQIPLEICERWSVCFHWSKYSYLLTHVASFTEFHYYFENCMKTQPNLSHWAWLVMSITASRDLCTEIHFCWKIKQGLLPSYDLLVNLVILLDWLEQRLERSTLILTFSRPDDFEQIFSDPWFLERVEMYKLHDAFSSVTPWFCKECCMF